MRPTRILPVLCVAALAAAGVGACGGDGGEEEKIFGGPATLAPDDAILYTEGIVRPEGQTKQNAEAALSKILDTKDPGTELIRLFNRSGDTSITYREDIEPWLGEGAGFFLSSLEREDPDGAFIVEATDTEAALDFFRRQNNIREDAAEKEAGGFTYQVDGEGDAIGVIEDFVVAGSESGFQAAAEASGGSNLKENSDFSDALDDAPSDRLALLYFVPNDAIDAVPEGEIDPVGAAILENLLGEAGEEPVLGTFATAPDSLEVEFSVGGLETETGDVELLTEVPAGAWFSVGLPDLGEIVRDQLQRVDELDLPVSEDTLRALVREETGIDLEEDISQAVSDAALFLTGPSESKLEAAAVLETGSGERLADKLAAALEQQPGVKLGGPSLEGGTGFSATIPGEAKPIQVLSGEDRLVIGYGEKASEAALDPPASLDSSELFGAAEATLDDLSMNAFLDVQELVGVLLASGDLAQGEYRESKRYVDHLSYMALGSGSDEGEDRTSFSVVFGVR